MTQKQALEKPITINFVSHGHWRITMNHYNKNLSCITNNSVAVDEYRSEENERDSEGIVWLRGYKTLKNEILRNYDKN